MEYNGKAFRYTENAKDGNDITIATSGNALDFTDVTTDVDKTPGVGREGSVWDKENVLKYFDVDSDDAVNYGESVIVRATAKPDSPYKGTIVSEALKVEKRAFKADEFVLDVEKGLSYQYTGNHVAVPTDKVTLKESSEILGGKDLSAAIKSAETTTSDLGKRTVTVTLDATKMPNFKDVASTMKTAKEVVEITKRDLSEVSTIASLKYGRVPVETSVKDFADKHLVLTDKNTKADVKLALDTDYVLSIKDPDNQTVTSSEAFNKVGTYVVTVFAKEKADPTCLNGQTLNVRVASNVIGNATFTNSDYKPYYTGEEIKPTKADLGKIIIKNAEDDNLAPETLKDDEYEIVGYKNNVNAKAGACVTIKVLGDSSYAGQTVDVPFTINPLIVNKDTVTVPKTVNYEKGFNNPEDYNVQLVVTATDPSGKIVKGLSDKDYSVEFSFENNATESEDKNNAKNELHDYIKAELTINNPNFAGGINPLSMPADKYTEIVEKALTDDMIKFNPATYTYTGGVITPTFVVMDGNLVLYNAAEYDASKAEYKVESIVNNKNVGKATLTVAGIKGKYSGKASADFEITPANTEDVKFEFTADDGLLYTGRQVRPRTFKATLNGNTVTDQFEIVGYGENISGKGTVVFRPVSKTKNFTGKDVTVEFNIVKEVVTGKLDVFNANGENVTDIYTCDDVADFDTTKKSFDFDGTAKKFATTLLKDLSSKKATVNDFEIKYVDNVSGKKGFTKDNNHYNIAYVYAVAKDGTGYAGPSDEEHTIVTADGTIIKNVVAKIPFLIKNVEFVEKNVTVTNGTYAGGFPVKPGVLVQIGGNTLVEGKDYVLSYKKGNTEVTPIDVTDGKIYTVVVKGINGYEGSEVNTLKWGIDKKNLKDCDVKVVNGVAYVMNGYVPVPVTEYTVKENDDKTYTVTANETSKNYTGSKTVVAEGQKPTDKPDAPMIQSVKVVGNKATVILSGETEGAVGYDYVISTDKDCINNKDYDKVNKNILNTTTDFTYVGQDVYYAYCHAWKRGEDGKKIFSDWSNAYPFVVSAITPSQPAITSVKVKGSTVTVTYTKSSNADGYDVVLGSKVATVAGEKRPVEYGTLVKKNIKGNTVTATFKNVKKGTYYAGLHAFNRTSEDGKKVFSPWSNVKRVTVK